LLSILEPDINKNHKKKQLQKNKKKYWKKIKQKYQWEEYTITLGKLSKIGWGRYNNPAFS
jgi:hypothetical protein